MTEYHWPQLRDHASELFRETPSAQLEQDVLTEFERRPAHVANLIDRIAAKVAAGKVHSGWAILRRELNQAPAPNVTATDEAEREKRIRNAKRWIDNAGLHYDRDDHVLAELFGDDYARGPLTDYADDTTLRAELVDHWCQQRPRGEQADANFEAWNAKCAADHQLVLETRKHSPSAEAVTSSTDVGHSSETARATEGEPITVGSPDDDIPF